jgi:glucodextranase-like protein
VFPGPLTIADVKPNADGTFAVNVQLSRGSNHIVVEVLDTTGKVGRVSRTVRLEPAGGAAPTGRDTAVAVERAHTRQ